MVENEKLRMNRRRFLEVGAASILSTQVPLSKAHASTAITFYSYGGLTQDALNDIFLEPIAERDHLTFIQSTFGDEAEVSALFKSGSAGTLNMFVNSGFDMYKRHLDMEIGSRLDEGRIPNLSLVYPALLDKLRAMRRDRALSAIPLCYGVTGIGYNTKHVSKDEAIKLGYGLLWDDRYRGRMALSGNAQERVWAAAVRTGQDPNAIERLDDIWDALREQKPLVKKYWSSGAESMDLLAREEVYVADIWSTRAHELQKQGFPIAFIQPQDCYAWVINIFVTQNSPMQPCEAILDFMLSPERNFRYCERVNNCSALDPRFTKTPDALESLPGYDPSGTFSNLKFGDGAYWAARLDQFEREWRRISRGR